MSSPPTFVLIGGEHWKAGSGPSRALEHVSLVHIGNAYARLRKHWPRDRIIVIAQLQDTLEYLERSATTGLPELGGDREMSCFHYAGQLERTRAACQQLIDEGGVDYDGEYVNPATVLAVLTGTPPPLPNPWMPQEPKHSTSVSAAPSSSSCTTASSSSSSASAAGGCGSSTGATVTAAPAIEEDDEPEDLYELPTSSSLSFGSSSGGHHHSTTGAVLSPSSSSSSSFGLFSSTHTAAPQQQQQHSAPHHVVVSAITTTTTTTTTTTPTPATETHATTATATSTADACTSAASSTDPDTPPPVPTLMGCSTSSGRVVRAEDAGSLFVAIYSHGYSHPVLPDHERTEARVVCDVCGEPHRPGVPKDHPHESAMSQEWYLHLPYPSPDETIYSSVAHAEYRHHACYLYATHLRVVFYQLLSRPTPRPIVCLLNFCRSGGALKFMQNECVRATYHSDRWPLFMMSSCQAMKSALVGGLWESWFACLDDHLSGSLIEVGGTGVSPRSLSLAAFYEIVLQRYFRENAYEIMNEVKNSCWVQPGYGNKFHVLLEQALQGLPRSLDYDLLTRVQNELRPIRSIKCVACGQFQGARDWQWLCSSCHAHHQRTSPREPIPPVVMTPVDIVEEVKSALARVAIPEEVHGVNSGITETALLSLFHSHPPPQHAP